MKYAIIAAGEGSRLSQEGITVSKPMVRLGGIPLIERLQRVFRANGASGICVVCNASQQDTIAFMEQEGNTDGLTEFITRQTPSSMHSFYELSPLLADEPFVLTTVDTIFRETEFSRYVAEFERLIATGEADGLMGVTDYIDDEKPLYVGIDETTGQITAFLDSDPQPHYISAGIYGLTPRALHTLDDCIRRGESRMRNYQRALLRDGLRLKAFRFSKVLDIDHASDIRKAEEFLNDNG